MVGVLAEEIGKMWPVPRQRTLREKSGQPEVSRCDFAGSVSATLPAILAEDVAIVVTSPSDLAREAFID